MDGHIMRCGTISSCQSAATYEIVKRCWSRVLTHVSGTIASVLTFTFTFQPICNIIAAYNIFSASFSMTDSPNKRYEWSWIVWRRYFTVSRKQTMLMSPFDLLSLSLSIKFRLRPKINQNVKSLFQLVLPITRELAQTKFRRVKNYFIFRLHPNVNKNKYGDSVCYYTYVIHPYGVTNHITIFTNI